MRQNQLIRDNLQRNESSCRILFQRLNERDQRHVAGLLALAMGYGGVSFVGLLVGMDDNTVAKGKKELLADFQDVPDDRIRRPGAGRPSIEKKVPKPSKNSKNLSKRKQAGSRPEDVNSFD